VTSKDHEEKFVDRSKSYSTAEVPEQTTKFVPFKQDIDCMRGDKGAELRAKTQPAPCTAPNSEVPYIVPSPN